MMLLERCSCRVWWMSRMVDEDFSTTASPREHANSVSIAGIFPISKSVDPSTPRAWHNSSTRNGRSACDIHIRTSIPSFDLLPGRACIRDRAPVYASPRTCSLVISSSFFLLRVRVISPRIASIYRETRRNLQNTRLANYASDLSGECTSYSCLHF